MGQSGAGSVSLSLSPFPMPQPRLLLVRTPLQRKQHSVHRRAKDAGRAGVSPLERPGWKQLREPVSGWTGSPSGEIRSRRLNGAHVHPSRPRGEPPPSGHPICLLCRVLSASLRAVSTIRGGLEKLFIEDLGTNPFKLLILIKAPFPFILQQN